MNSYNLGGIAGILVASVVATGIGYFQAEGLRDEVTKFSERNSYLESRCTQLKADRDSLEMALIEQREDIVSIDNFYFSLKEFIQYSNSNISDPRSWRVSYGVY